jgi:cytosine deaminase
VGLVDGRITFVRPADLNGWHAQQMDAHGRLLTPGLTDPHLHPDKAFALELEAESTPVPTTLANALDRVRSHKRDQTADQIYARTLRLAEWCVQFGTTRARVHAEVDPMLGLRSVEGVLLARKMLASRCHLQVVAFPQEGIVREPGTLELLREAMRLGCDVVGAIGYQDPDPREHLALAASIAREFGTELDVHIDFGQPLERSVLSLLAEITRQHGLQGKVLAGHATTLALMSPRQRAFACEELADAGIAICALPRTDLFMDHRVAPLEALRTAGVAVCMGTNNVLNAFTPVGRPSLTSVASIYALVAGVSRQTDLSELARSLWTAPECLGMSAPTLSEGAAADLCLWPVASPWELVARESEPDLVFVGGAAVHASRAVEKGTNEGPRHPERASVSGRRS